MSLCITKLQKGNTITFFFPSEESWQDIFKSQSHDTLGLMVQLNILEQWSPNFGHPRPVSWKTIFPQTRVGDGLGDSRTLHLLCTLLHQLHLRSSGMDSQRLRIPPLELTSKFGYRVGKESKCVSLFYLLIVQTTRRLCLAFCFVFLPNSQCPQYFNRLCPKNSIITPATCWNEIMITYCKKI